MISFLNRYRRPLFIAVVAIFLIGTFVGLGGYLFVSRDITGSVASVGSEKIPYSRYISRVNQYADALRNRGSDINEAAMKEIKQAMLRDMIVDQLLLTKAEELGIRVTDDELARDVRNTPGFQREGRFSQEIYFNALRSVLHETPQGYEETRRRQIEASRLKQLLYYSAKLSPEELRQAYAKANGGSLKAFDKKKEEFSARAQQQRALDLINYYLRQLSTQVEIRSFLEQRESGS